MYVEAAHFITFLLAGFSAHESITPTKMINALILKYSNEV